MTDHHHHQHHPDPHVHADGSACSCDTLGSAEASTTAIDPVCGMTVEKEGAKHVAAYQQQTYYFCSASCRATFLDNPQKYAARGNP